jgi:hypothetical protein
VDHAKGLIVIGRDGSEVCNPRGVGLGGKLMWVLTGPERAPKGLGARARKVIAKGAEERRRRKMDVVRAFWALKTLP